MANDAPINPQLVQAIAAVLDASTTELDVKLRAVLKELLLSSLITTSDPFPATVETEDDDSYLALFTDLIELHFFEPGARWQKMSPEEAIRRVANDEHDGLVVFGGGRRLELSADDVRDMFDIDPR